jgi:hypothetical protein
MTTDIAGYIASALVLLTFMTKDMRLLRIVAILSNVAFIAYGVLGSLAPIFVLHLLLLPLNVVRLKELQRSGCEESPSSRISTPARNVSIWREWSAECPFAPASAVTAWRPWWWTRIMALVPIGDRHGRRRSRPRCRGGASTPAW